MAFKGETTIIAITDKYITEPPYFVEIAHCEPSRLGEEVQEQIKKVVHPCQAAYFLIGLQAADNTFPALDEMNSGPSFRKKRWKPGRGH